MAPGAWFIKHSGDHSHPLGQLKPNDLGLFDMHGSAWAWCQNVFFSYPRGTKGNASVDSEDSLNINYNQGRAVRGASCLDLAMIVRSAQRLNALTGHNDGAFVLRLTRTYD